MKDLCAQLTALEADLRSRARDVPEFAAELRPEYDQATAAECTAAGFTEWSQAWVI